MKPRPISLAHRIPFTCGTSFPTRETLGSVCLFLVASATPAAAIAAPQAGSAITQTPANAAPSIDQSATGTAPAAQPAPTAAPDLPPPANPDASDSDGLVALNKRLGLKGWNIPFPAYEDTITQDAGGYRTALAKLGIGFTSWNQGLGAANLLDRPRRTGGQQVYWGQKPSAGDIQAIFLTFDLGKIGIENGQLQIGTSLQDSTYQPFVPKAAGIYRLAYYQSLWNNRVEFTIGLLGNGPTFVGTYVGGQLQNPFGPNAAIPTQAGLSASAISQPTAWIKIHPSKTIYNMVGVARSISPGGVLEELRVNPTSTHFHVPGSRALFVEEFGFQKASTPTQHSTWLRAGVIHNTTRYPVYASDRTATKTAWYALADRQLTQPDKSENRAYRGLYLGATAMYISPRTSIFSQYYEARLYGKGLFESRPSDTISFVFTHQVTSHRLAATYNLTAQDTGVYAARFTNSVTGSYTAKLFRGTYATLGLQYLDRPSFTYSKEQGDALNLLVGTFLSF